MPFVPAEFWGIKVGPNEAVVVGKETSEDDQFLHTYHLSQVALGLNPKQGRHVVFLEYDGQKSVIGAVTPGVIEQFQIDFPVNCEVKLSHSGKSDVYITGYTTRQFLGYDSSDPEDEWATDSDEEPAELARQQLAMNGQPGGRNAAKRRTLQQMADDEDVPAGASDPAARLRAQAHQFSDMDDDDDDDEFDSDDEGDDDDDDEDDQPAVGARAALGALFDQQGADEDDSDDEGEDEDEDDDDDEDEEDDDDEDEDAVAANPKVGDKRPAAVKTAATPQKKANTAAQAPAATPGSPGSIAKYQADLVKFLKTNGPTKLSVLGSQVKRATGLPKMKKFLEDRTAVFKLDTDSGMAALA